MAQLVDLAPELLIAILRQLPYQGLLRCLRVCRLFFDVITKSPDLDYHIHLQVAGMWNNPECSVSIPMRLALLNKREESWDFLKPSSLAKFPIPGISSLLFDLSPTIFSLGTAPNEHSYKTEGIQSVQLPFLIEDDSNVETMSWDFVNLGMRVIEYALSIEVNDLLVLVIRFAPLTPCLQTTYLSTLSSEADENEPTTAHLAIVLLQYSTKKTHELAENPIFPLCTATEDMGIPSVGLDISEENLAVSIVFEEPTMKAAASTLCIFNWRTGKSKTVSASSFNWCVEYLTP